MKKAFLRKEFLGKRMALTQEERAALNLSVTERTLSYLSGITFSTIHVFLPHPSKNEVDCRPLISILRKTAAPPRIAAPYVLPGTKEMEHYLLTEESILVLNQWNIPEPEPQTSTRIEPKQIDLVLVPLLAFDQRGFRVGYGGGYYDRFLSECRDDILKIGLSFFEPVQEISDTDNYDIPLNACVTPYQVYRF
ncbi:5-formyltetrahydrofolate cyclo-ligase [Dyadobacter crusticola]|uniref:5-formyltetrahydrofolate cyclo-ligase n=1 Tax=Dyadobacter crusticola TaxID=292407 RepID=UPI0004E1F582|nr:5-formyltetrahydrofolate cyclo-ligase [Dyadobacter crusticola]